MPRQTIGRGFQICVGPGETMDSQTAIEVTRTMPQESRLEGSAVEHCTGGASTSDWAFNAVLRTSVSRPRVGWCCTKSSPQKCYAKTI